jgi:hypothetical protein
MAEDPLDFMKPHTAFDQQAMLNFESNLSANTARSAS